MTESAAQTGPEMTSTMAASGYLHPAYAASLAELGRARPLPRSGGWVLERAIPGRAGEHDALGCYPLFCCRDWAQLRTDLDGQGDELVSLALVTDPFGAYDEALLRDCFKNLVVPFKQHFVVDLNRPAETFVHPHHRRNARKAQARLQVERCAEPASLLADWTALYSALRERHGITGLAAFSPECFARQLAVPGLVALRATHDGATVGMLLWYVQGDLAYYHLGAHSRSGYELRASFALFSYAIDYFARQGLRYLSLGGGAGAEGGGTSGLSRFKAGWSNETRTAYFCGRIFDPQRYAEIVRAKGVPPTEYFPAYRLGEFR